MKYVSAIVSALFLLLLILFATSNKDEVHVDFYPVPDAIFAGPIYLLVILAVALGFVVGAFVAWNAGRRHRRANRQGQRRIVSLESDLASMRSRAETAEERFAQAVTPRLETSVFNSEVPNP